MDSSKEYSANLLVVTIITVVISYFIWRIWWFAPIRQVYEHKSRVPENNTEADVKSWAEIEDNFRKTIGQVIGSIAILVGASFAYYGTQQTILASEHQSGATMVENEMYKGFEHIGSKILAIKIGGIHKLQEIIEHSKQHRSLIISVLCAYIRSNTSNDNDDSVTPIDVEAALKVVGSRFEDDTDTLDLREVKIYGIELRNVNFRGAKFNHAVFHNVDLSGANLDNTDLTDSDLRGVRLIGTTLTNAILIQADFGFNKNNKEPPLNSVLYFTKLNYANLTNSILKGANLHGADLTGAELTGVDLSSVTFDDRTQLDKTCGAGVTMPSDYPPIQDCKGQK